MLDHLGAQASDRKLLLVVVACYRRERGPLDDLVRSVVEALEEYADDRTPLEEVERLQSAARAAWMEAGSDLATDALDDVVVAPLLFSHPRLWAEVSLRLTAPAVGREEQVRLLGCVLGPLHRVRVASPSWLTSTVVALAQQMYESGNFSVMPILADALQDAGCENPAILPYCRGRVRTSAGVGWWIWYSARSSIGAS